MRGCVSVFAVFCLVGLAPSPLFAPIIPGLDLPWLCDHAGLIAVGRAKTVRQVGEADIVLQDQRIPARFMFVELEEKKVLKGTSPSAAISFSFKSPSAPIVSFGYEEVRAGHFGVFFLRETDYGYEVLDPYHPFVIAAPGAASSSRNLLDQVTSEVGQVLASVEASMEDKMQAVLVLNTLRTPLSNVALQAATRDKSTKVRLTAIGALLARNDISELAAAVGMLINPPPEIGPNLVAGLAYAIRDGVKDARAIPPLARLLGSADVGVRRGAVSALRNTLDQKAIEPLTQAVNDTDREVQYQAVIGLAEITGAASEWSPATDTFNQDPNKYLDYWRDWAKSRK